MEDAAHARGAHAHRPRDIPAAGWKDIVFRVKSQVSQDNLSIVSAGVAYYSLLALFPALAAIVALYGIIASPSQVEQQVTALGQIMPQAATEIITQQLGNLAQTSDTALGVGLLVAVLVSLFSAMKGMTALMTALNIVYGEQESRGFFQRNGIALLLTLGAVVFAVITLLLIVAVPALLSVFEGLGSWVGTLINLVRWPILGVVMVFGLAVVYRYAPDRDRPKWRWVSWGAVMGTLLWLIASGLFSLYVSRFGSFNETYGSIGGVVILLMWFYVTAYVILASAEFDAEMEYQTEEDTTEGRAQPMGRRGARVADTSAHTKPRK